MVLIWLFCCLRFAIDGADIFGFCFRMLWWMESILDEEKFFFVMCYKYCIMNIVCITQVSGSRVMPIAD